MIKYERSNMFKLGLQNNSLNGNSVSFTYLIRHKFTVLLVDSTIEVCAHSEKQE